MLERGFIVGATRLTKRVWQLYVAHIILFVIYIVFDQLPRAAFWRSGDHQRIQRRRPGRQRDRNAASGTAAEIQARQSGRASALHRADGTVSAGAVDDAAPARPDDAGIDRAVARGPAVRLEFRRLSRRQPGTSIRTAGRCCSCSARGARWAGRGGRGRLSMRPITLYFCIAYLIFAMVMTMAGKFPDFGALFPHWLYRYLQSQRQDQSGALSLPAFRGDRDSGDPVRAEGLAGSGMEDLRSR